jgi:hypothetical protein
MKYLYIFKKINGELFVEGEVIAYKYIFQGENLRDPLTYIGRLPSNEYLTGKYEMIEKVKEFKNKLLTETVGLQKAIDNSNGSGAFSQIEADYAKKVQDFSVSLEKELLEKLALTSKKEFMDKHMNIDTPGGDRQAIINLLR